jgi:hypothetical protein
VISVVCVYNKKKIFDDYLGKSLQRQTVQFELIALDNSDGKFTSAAQALNYGAQQIKAGSRYILFAHQDIDLSSPVWLEETEKLLDGLPDVGAAGVAGNNEDEKKIISNIQHGIPPHDTGKKIREPVRVMTLDECCLIVPRSVFKNYCFDETTCSGWHAYAVDYCLSLGIQGFGVYVLPVTLYHISEGKLSIDYFRGLKKVLRKHRCRYGSIHTTCGSWETGTPVSIQWLLTIFYGCSRKLLSSGLVPEWMQQKKRKRLEREAKNCPK